MLLEGEQNKHADAMWFQKGELRPCWEHGHEPKTLVMPQWNHKEHIFICSVLPHTFWEKETNF